MVQHAGSGILPGYNGLNEFQLVHAYITQSLKGFAETSKDASYAVDSQNAVLESKNPTNSFISTLYQTFSFDSSSQKGVIPRTLKDFISQLRKSQESPTTAFRVTSKGSCYVDRYSVATQNQSCALCYASVLKTSSVDEKLTKTVAKRSSFNSTSNVQNKVLQFEKHASSVLTTGSRERVCTKCNAGLEQRKPVQTSCAEVCPGGTYYRSVDRSTNSSRSKSPPPPAPNKVSKVSTDRNLKRVPSERFQKMRKKIQKLMQRRSDDDKPTVDRVIRSVYDESSFLESLRIPLPTQQRDDYARRPCLILRLPDHVLCQIFSLLDTRTLASLKCACNDFNFLIVNFDIRATDSLWTKDDRYLADPCKQCRHIFVRGDMSMCRYHHKRYYSDLRYGRSYWMCCRQYSKSAQGCKTGLHDNNWLP